jgi:hypothetical protein
MEKFAAFIFFLIILSCEFSVGFREDHKSSVPAVSKTWVINMNKRSSRLNLVQVRLRELKIPYHRYGGLARLALAMEIQRK